MHTQRMCYGLVTVTVSHKPVFSERELTFTFAICCRPSVCLSSVCRKRSCTLVRRLKFSAIFLRQYVPWPSVDIHWKFHGDRPRGTPPPRELNTREVVKYSDFRHRCKIGGKLVLITNRKSYAFDWYQNRWPWMTLNGVMAVILRYFSEFSCTMLP